MCVAFGSKTDPEDAYQLDAWINTEDIDLVDFFGYREHSEKDEELIRKWHKIKESRGICSVAFRKFTKHSICNFYGFFSGIRTDGKVITVVEGLYFYIFFCSQVLQRNPVVQC